MIKAGIDLGTHTGRLIIAEVENNAITKILEKKTKIIALGEGASLTGKISDDAIKRAIELFQEFRTLLDKYKVVSLKAVATNAVRIASNREDVVAGIARETGIGIEVISGEQEATLGYLGIRSSFAGINFLSFDIGGGSTEFTLNYNDTLAAHFSLQIGAVSLTEKYCHSDPISDEEFNNLKRAAREPIKAAWPRINRPFDQLIGVAGTVTNLAAIKLEMVAYCPEKIHTSSLSPLDIDDMISNFRRRTIAQRKEIIGLEPKRAEFILAGTLLVQSIQEAARAREIIVSESDILEGLVLA